VDEITELKWDDVFVYPDEINVAIPDHGKKRKFFSICKTNQVFGCSYDVLEHYIQHFPMPIRTGRFLKYIRAGQGTEVPAGKKIVRRVPRIVAETLGLENPHRFTKSSFTNTRAVISVALKGLAITEDASGMLMSFFILMCSGQNTC
jgi:hypothetical protein